MSELLHQFHFLRPWWLLALLPLPLLGWSKVRRDQGQMALSRLVDPALLPHLLRGRAASAALPLWLFALGWVLCALALAGPTWSRVEQPLYANRAAQVVALSLSQRMMARDVAPSRLDRARFKARDLLRANHDGLNALIGYAGEAFVVAPLTTDAHSLDDLLEAMAPDIMPVDGDDMAAAIDTGVKLIHDGKAGGGSLVLITDHADREAQAAARAALAAGVRVSVLGVGTPSGGPVPLADGGFLHDADGNLQLAQLDDASLRALAAAGGGRYVVMSADRRDVEQLQSELKNAPTRLADGQRGDAWQDRGPWLLLPLLLLVALGFRRGWLMLVPLVLLPLAPGTAHAANWKDLWQRPDQQAAQALRDGDAKRAQQLAQDPAWRGAAAYRAGDFPAAKQALSQAPGSDGVYNLGNALARQGDYPQAIKAYDQALKLDPDNADAEANRKAVEDWLRQQQEQQQDQNSQDQQPRGGDEGKNSQSSSAQHDQDSAKNGQGESSAKDDKQASEGADQGGDPATDQKPGEPSSDGSGEDQSSPPEQPSAEQQAQDKAQRDQAQQALKQQMDQALANPDNPDKPGDDTATHQLGALTEDDPQANLPAEVRHALQRVPDDPGALLRRKFALEYQQRHGGARNEEGQP